MSNSLTPLNFDCFTNIIGLSRIDCECFDENINWDESYSGLYVDEAEGLSLKMVDAVKDCENDNNIWLLMDTARSNAIRQFVSDTNMRLLQKYQLARSNFYGNIGRLDYKKDLVINNTYAGIRIATANVVGGWMKIKEITTLFSGVSTRTLTIYNNLNEVVDTVNIDTVDGRKVNPVNIVLPLWDTRTTALEYYFVYAVNPAIPCKNNDINCSTCSGVKYSFDMDHPYYKSVSNKLAGWSKWAMIGEWSGDTLDFSDVCTFADNTMNGLSIGVDFYCDLSKQYCFDNPDITDPIFITVAFALQYLTAHKLLIEIISSPNVSRYTMVGTEGLQSLIAYHKGKYDEAIDWLIKNANTQNTDCLACRDNIKMGVGTL